MRHTPIDESDILNVPKDHRSLGFVLVKQLLLTLIGIALLAVVLCYTFFPSLVRHAIEQSLPEHIVLSQLDISRPTLSALHIPSIIISQEQPIGSRLHVQGLVLEFSWFPMTIQTLSLERTHLAVLSVDTVVFEQSTEPEGAPIHPSKALSFLVPNSVIIKEFLIETSFALLPGMLIKGHGEFEKGALSGHISVEAVEKLKASLTLSSLDKKKGLAQLQIQSLDLELLNILTIALGLPVEELTGRLGMDVEFNYRFDQPAWQADAMVLSGLLAPFSDDALYIETLSGKVSLEGMSTVLQQLPLQQTNATIQFEKNPHWRLFNSSVDTFLDVQSLNLPLTESIVPLSSQIRSLDLRQEVLYSDVEVTVDKKHTFSIQSQTPLDVRIPGTYKVSLAIDALDESFSPHLKDISFEALNTRAQFELVNNTDWFVRLLQTESVIIQGVKYRGYPEASVGSIEANLSWQPLFKMGDDPFEASHFLLQSLRITDKALGLSTQANVFGSIKKTKEAYDFEMQVKPANTPQSSYPVLLDGSLSGNLQLGKAVTFQTHMQVDINEPLKNSLVVAPQLSQLQEVMELNRQGPVQWLLDLSGRQMLNEGSLNDPVFLKGQGVTSGNYLAVANSSASELTVQLRWPQMVPWHQFEFSAQTQLDYKGLDKQSHQIQAQISLEPEFKVKGLGLSSSLFQGTLTATTAPKYQGFDHLEGVVDIQNINLASISQLINNSQLRMTGDINGTIPFEFRDNLLFFNRGEMRSDNGVIEYLPEGKKVELTKENMSSIANIALQNFHYSLMNAKLENVGPCELNLNIRLEGKNPDLGQKQSQVFNIDYHPSSNVNLYYLLLLGEENIQKLDLEQLYSGCEQPIE